ncbi:adenylate/guanylate cyclase domain-containing protein [Psychrobacter aestuarii]|uniref:adenylate/guanylate cyclase domain-containing protein n=1 Tax=Psychrobacter aestuarii TaxID=556327 RepID=UPI001D0FFC2D|nr:adenylate/guanylate cyclase domain-containing protein [Psychrobacter aestuarii]
MSSRNNGRQGFDYPELFVLLLTVFLIAWNFDFGHSALALMIVIGVPSVMLLIYNYSRDVSFWTTSIVVVLLAAVIGAMQFCAVLSLSLILMIGYRIIISHPDNRFKLSIVALVNVGIFYAVSWIMVPSRVSCANTIVPDLVLLASIVVMLWQFGRVYYQYVACIESSQQAKSRLGTMVSVINKLTRFIQPQIWQPIVKTDSPVDVTNKRARLTIMFSDIVGFTELSDSLSADNLADILNTYMHHMTGIANKHGAVLDKFIGDGMVCFFGEPNSRGARQDALDCVAMAIDMRREMRSLRQKWRLMGFEGLYVRIGITTGYCHVGNFGSKSRLSYTLIGKEANLASRLESAAGKGEIFISQTTYDYICHDYECEFAGNFNLKGFDEPIQAWQVLDPDVHKGQSSKWVDHTLPGFNLHLNFKDMKNYDYQEIKSQLSFALERLEKEERVMMMGEDEPK